MVRSIAGAVVPSGQGDAQGPGEGRHGVRAGDAPDVAQPAARSMVAIRRVAKRAVVPAPSPTSIPEATYSTARSAASRLNASRRPGQRRECPLTAVVGPVPARPPLSHAARGTAG